MTELERASLRTLIYEGSLLYASRTARDAAARFDAAGDRQGVRDVETFMANRLYAELADGMRLESAAIGAGMTEGQVRLAVREHQAALDRLGIAPGEWAAWILGGALADAHPTPGANPD